MIEGRARGLLGAALIVVMFALMGLQSLSSVDWQAPSGVHVARAQSIPSFKERLEESGSLEALVAESPDGWVPVAPGVDYQLFQLPDPNNVHVARMDRATDGLFLESSIAQGRLSGGVERTSSMFTRYDGAVNYWGQTWGQTNDVLVAINGSFYNSSGVPDRGVIHSGWYAKRFTDNQNGSGFAWKLDGTAFIGECVRHDSEDQIIVYPGATTEKYQGVNTTRGSDDLILFTPQYDSSTGTDGSGVEMLVEMTRPNLILPPSSGVKAYGTVREIRDLQGDTPIPFDHIVLSATGIKRTKLLNNLQVGDVIGINSSVSHFSDADCATPVSGKDWTKTYAAVGGSFFFLENGVINIFSDTGANVRNPRTAIAYNDSYIFFIVVDGRDPGISIGMNMTQLGTFARDTLGATYGINQDGGGSSTMVIDGEVVNNPSDLTQVPCPYQVFLPVVFRNPTTGDPIEPEEPRQLQECYAHTERAVSNGMMMVFALPMTQSALFSPGQGITNPLQTSLYLGPGTNYSALVTVPAGTTGTVLAHSAGLDGVYAKGEYWWKVAFGGVEGWVPQSALNAAP